MDNTFYNSKFLSSYKSRIRESYNKFAAVEDEPSLVSNLNMSDKDLALEAMIVSMIETLEECQCVVTEEDSDDEMQLNEGVAQAFRKAKDAVSKTIVKFTLADKQMSERINEKFNRYIQIYKDSKRNSAYDSIVKRSIDLSRMLKNLIRSVIVGLLIPGGIPVKVVSAIITILVQTAMDKRTDDKYKNLIYNDLRFELKVVQEKIKDAESRGDIKAKYKLMRIENQIGRALDRIKYGIND